MSTKKHLDFDTNIACAFRKAQLQEIPLPPKYVIGLGWQEHGYLNKRYYEQN